MELVKIARELATAVDALSFSQPVTHVYNPLRYAWKAHAQYLRRWGSGRKEILMVGMNPGPWGMTQTGVPFGEVDSVRAWLGISEGVEKPPAEHPRRPIQGFECPRREVSGARLWGWARDRFERPEVFFTNFFVYNYCPLVFLEASGRNRTPDKLKAAEKAPLFSLCNSALRQVVAVLRPRIVFGVGIFAQQRALESLQGKAVEIGRILHPSPASPKANRGWAVAIEAELQEQGVSLADKTQFPYAQPPAVREG